MFCEGCSCLPAAAVYAALQRANQPGRLELVARVVLQLDGWPAADAQLTRGQCYSLIGAVLLSQTLPSDLALLAATWAHPRLLRCSMVENHPALLAILDRRYISVGPDFEGNSPQVYDTQSQLQQPIPLDYMFSENVSYSVLRNFVDLAAGIAAE